MCSIAIFVNEIIHRPTLIVGLNRTAYRCNVLRSVRVGSGRVESPFSDPAEIRQFTRHRDGSANETALSDGYCCTVRATTNRVSMTDASNRSHRK